jgi:hypothetical protein
MVASSSSEITGHYRIVTAEHPERMKAGTTVFGGYYEQGRWI